MDNERREELFFDKIISRKSSLGCSSRIYYYRSSEGIPFNWERRPGTPKQPQEEDDVLPPISPPPAVVSLSLPKPCLNVDVEPKPTMKLRLMKFLKQGKKKISVNGEKKSKVGDSSNVMSECSDKYWSSYEMCSSDDGDFMAASPPRMSSSSSSSSFSFPNGLSFRSSRFSSPPCRDVSLHNHKHYGCSPLNLSSIFVRVSRSRRL